MSYPPPGSSHCSLLSILPEGLVTLGGSVIDVWKLTSVTNQQVLSEWAKHFRDHYCLDEELDELRTGTGLSRADYLTNLIFPDATVAPGPSVRAGDFAEILVSDYLEFIQGFYVPRDRYSEKAVRNESVKGADVLGFRMREERSGPADELMVFEVKAHLSNKPYERRLQDAIDDSAKDYFRLAVTLNATKRRLFRSGDEAGVKMVGRFQNMADNPYVRKYGAAAVLSETAYNPEIIAACTDVSPHHDSAALSLLVIFGSDLMALVHALYDRAANEA